MGPTGVMIVTPALSSSFPGGNPAVRLFEFHDDFRLKDATTYVADLHEANRDLAMTWVKEYSFRELFQMPDLSPASWSSLVERMTEPGSWEWSRYCGAARGTIRCRGYVHEPGYERPFS